jgi:hypothetical protein
MMMDDSYKAQKKVKSKTCNSEAILTFCLDILGWWMAKYQTAQDKNIDKVVITSICFSRRRLLITSTSFNNR